MSWALGDPSTNELFVFDLGPTSAPPTRLEKSIVYASTSTNKAVVFQRGEEPVEATISGTLTSMSQLVDLRTWAKKRHVLLLRDDLNREFPVYIMSFSPSRVRTSDSDYWVADYSLVFKILESDATLIFPTPGEFAPGNANASSYATGVVIINRNQPLAGYSTGAASASGLLSKAIPMDGYGPSASTAKGDITITESGGASGTLVFDGTTTGVNGSSHDPGDTFDLALDLDPGGLTVDAVVWKINGTICRDDDLDAPYQLRYGGAVITFGADFYGQGPGHTGTLFNLGVGTHTFLAEVNFTDLSTLEVSADVTVDAPPSPPSGSRPLVPSDVGYVGAGYVAGDLVNDHTGTYTISGDGGTYQFLDVVGKIRITGNNNTLQFGRVVASAAVNGNPGTIEITGQNNVIEDFEIMASADLLGGTPRTANVIWCNADSPFTLRRCYLAGSGADAIKVNTNGGDTTIESCLIEERYAFAAGAHADGIQSQQGGGGLYVRNCTIEWGIPDGYGPGDVPGTVSQGQAIWVQNDVDLPKAFTELYVTGSRCVATSKTIGLGGVTGATTRVHFCNNELVSDSDWEVIHSSTVSAFAPTFLAWDNNIDLSPTGGGATVPPPNGQTANETCEALPSALMLWEPPDYPTYAGYTTWNISSTGADITYNASTNEDVLINQTAIRTGTIRVDGARNVVFIGGEVNVSSDNGSDNANMAFRATDCTGVVHVEGLHAYGDFLVEGINGGSASAPFELQVQNCFIDYVHGSLNLNNSDLIQMYAGASKIRVFRVTGKTHYQGLMLKSDSGPAPDWDVRECNIYAFNAAKSDSDPGAGSRHIIYNAGSIGGCYFEPGTVWTTLNSFHGGLTSHVWLTGSNGTDATGAWVELDGDESPVDETGGSTTTLPRIYSGTPSGGDYCPETTPGIAYSAPGYE